MKNALPNVLEHIVWLVMIEHCVTILVEFALNVEGLTYLHKPKRVI